MYGWMKGVGWEEKQLSEWTSASVPLRKVNDMKLIKKEITLQYFEYACMCEGRLMVEIMAYVPVTECI